MADLETAAETALVKVKQLSERKDEAHGTLERLSELLGRVDEQVEADWSALREDLRSNLERVREDKARLAEGGEEAAEALGELHVSIRSVHSDAQEEAFGSGQEVSALASAIDARRPELARLVEAAGAAANALRERVAALEAGLEEALDEAREFLSSDVVNELRRLEEEVGERARILEVTLGQECTAALEDKYDNWLSTLNEVEEIVAEAFERARTHLSDVAEFALIECGGRAMEAADELQDDVALLESAASSLAEATVAVRRDVEQGVHSLGDSLQETDQHAQAMSAALGVVMELLASFTFVRA